MVLPKGALKPLPQDDRDHKLGAVTKLPALSDLPSSFKLDPLGILDQQDSDFCTAFSSCGCSAIQEGVKLVPEYSFALGKEIEGGDVDSYGLDLRIICKAHVNVGAIAEADRPAGFVLGEKDAHFLRRIENWPPTLKAKALEHSKGSFASITGPYDLFDNIRASIWAYRAEKRGVEAGALWSTPAEQSVVDTPSSTGDGHAFWYCGWKLISGQPYLILTNSWGDQVGDHGYFYVSRAWVNANGAQYGAFMFLDMTPDEYHAKLENRVTIYTLILSLWQKIAVLLNKQNAGMPPDTRLATWALAIQEREGWKPGSRSYRNCNPGNLKYVGQRRAIGKDAGGFCIFPSYAAGFASLIDQLRLVASGNSQAYSAAARKLGLHDSSELNLYQFYTVYAPAEDQNDPSSYAHFVAQYLGVTVGTLIRDL